MVGTHYNCITEAVLTSTYNLCFEQEYEKCRNFFSENFPFLVVKFSIYLNRCVFVMWSDFTIKWFLALMSCVESEDTDQSVYPHSLISILFC